MNDNDAGLASVQSTVDNAPALPPAPEEPGSGGADATPTWSGRDLPDDCPVKPLGMNGLVRYYLDESQQVIELSLREHSRNNLSGIFGNRNYLLQEYFPRFNKEGGRSKGFAADEAADTLMRAAAKKGVWDPFQKLRGPGAWLGDEGELVLHCGDKVLYGGAWELCGELGRFIYPTAPPGPKPSTIRAAGGHAGPAQELLVLLKTWNWRRPDLDPYLLLGWIMAAMVGGALKWRPAMWITGDRATGKTTLIDKVLREIFDAESGGAFILTDATAAGIWQHTKHSTLPIILDELEPQDKDGRREKQLIGLARLAASGGVTVRGGADHGGAEFTIRSCFAFSSVLVPPLQPQDRSRLAILELENLGDRKAPVIDPKKMRALGARLRRRLVDQWSRFADTFEAYASALADAGHQGRGADQYGTLLACHDLALQDMMPSTDELTEWGEKLKASVMAERADDLADHQRCWQHLMTFSIDAWRGGSRRTVAQWILDAIRDQTDEPQTANLVLETFGLKVRVQPALYQAISGEPSLPPAPRYWLYVANAHQGLAQIFADTHWTAHSGASAVWVQALRRMENAEASEPQKFAGVTIRATKLPIDSMAAKAPHA